MSTSYTPAPDTVALMVNERLKKTHPDLAAAGVRVGVLFAWNEAGPALKLHGCPANATIRVVSHKDRVTKGYDAEMLIDARRWDGFRHKQRLALIAHELYHLTLCVHVDKETGRKHTQVDEGGRPKLKTRPGDWDAGDGFAEIVAEFGEDSIEHHNIRQCFMLAEQAREIGEAAAEARPSTAAEPDPEEPEEVYRIPDLAARFKDKANETPTRPASGAAETPDGGRASVTVSSGGVTATITAGQFGRLADTLRKAGYGGAEVPEHTDDD